MKNVLFINGSLNGRDGNTGKIVDIIVKLMSEDCNVIVYDLASSMKSGTSRAAMWLDVDRADAMLFATGTYWDCWGSSLQQFLEESTELEGSKSWLGKPAGVIVTEHSCGGKGVLSRLQGVLSTFGVMIPPMSGMVYSMANHLALNSPPNHLQDDLWCIEDIAVICHNLREAMKNGNDWKAWGIDTRAVEQSWLR